ncbi:hypothetical protein GPECTOR_66g251 [Gonium pectorale]|uniref:COR domain-containing protein n=1 Tax=Gonium pectorale TaxID=33097 RepID=A0A150G420_GONPE|nr:hypothetical protein GPECTOR_66g251 [Gonium pectorale]|eukprot:KXZ44523.1 hypothetical protein GPECTOR_66g251 [Gonium pectorale]
MDVAELLISLGASLTHPDKDGDTPLHNASHWGQTGVVQALLRAGAPLEARNNDGLTPLHGACQGGHRDVVEALLRAGADHEAKTNDGKTPLDLAVAEGFGGLADRLRQHAADMATSVRVAPRSKVVLVGPGAAGKTTLAHRLVHDEYKANIPATDNLKVHDWALKGVEQQPPTMLSIWDLGGQHGFWSTHAIFMSPEAVYITVYNSRDGGQGASVDAYLDRVQTLAPGAINMVVGAWADKGYTGQQPPAAALSGYKNPVSIPNLPDGECLCLSSMTENGIAELKQAIMELTGVIQSASVVNVVRLPEPYVRLRDKVRRLREQIKNEDRPRLVPLEDIIRDMGTEVPQEADLHRFLSKLADFGELLQFQHVSGLEDKVVIDPEWLADVLGDVVTRDKDKQQRLQLLGGRIGMSKVHEVMEARCPDHANELVRILEAYGLLYDLGDGEQAIIPPMLPTLAMDDAEKLMQRPKAGPLRVVACGSEPALLGLLVSSQLSQLRDQFPGVKLSSVEYDCPECLGCKGSNDEPRATPRSISAKAAWNQKRADECDECREPSDMSMYALDEQAVDWCPVKAIRGETAGTLKLRRSLGAMERVVERVKDMPDGTALTVELRQSLVLRAVALHKLVGPSGGEPLPLAVLLPAPDDGANNHRMELDFDSTTSGLPGSVRLHALCEYPGGLHLTDHRGYEVTEGRAWLQKHGRGLRPLLRALRLAGVSGPVGTLGAGDPEVEAMYGGQEMQRTHSRGRGRSGGRVTGWGEGGPTQQLDSMLACLDRLVEQADAQLRPPAVTGTPAAGGKGGNEGKPADLYSACQEACSSVVKIVKQGNMEAAAGGMPRLQRVVTRTAGAMWLCVCHAEELGRMPLRSL